MTHSIGRFQSTCCRRIFIGGLDIRTFAEKKRSDGIDEIQFLHKFNNKLILFCYNIIII